LNAQNKKIGGKKMENKINSITGANNDYTPPEQNNTIA
jgi:hypothetical protein